MADHRDRTSKGSGSIAEFLQQQDAFLASVYEQIGLMDQQWKLAVANFSDGMKLLALPDVSKIVIPDDLAIFSAINVPDFYRNVNEACIRLASCGWTLPWGLTFAEIGNLANHCGNQEMIDEYFCSFYSADNFRQLRDVRESLIADNSLAQWRPLLVDCFDIYEMDRHRPMIPSLLTVIEGVIARENELLTSRKTGISLLPKTPLPISNEVGTLRALAALSVAMLFRMLWQDSSFSDPAPGKLNRHWVLHGRDQTNWTRADALRLINVLQTIR